MEITVIVVGVRGAITKLWVQGLEDLEKRERVEAIQSTASVRILRDLRLAVTQAQVENH